jgi:polar amino acid transport system permease protein
MTGPAGNAGHGAHASALEQMKVGRADEIVDAVARSRRRQRGRFRLVFVLTWIVLVGLLVGSLLVADKIDGAFIAEWAPYILSGVPITVIVSVASIALAIVLATLGALGRLSANPVIYGIASFYVSLVRGTPLIVQLLFFYLALPQIWRGFAEVDLMVLGIMALAFNYGAYMTEIFRAGIQAIPRGQIEAASALGMTERLTMRRIILPQAVRIITPAIGNEFIAMIKDSALVSIITVQELLWRAQRIGQSNFRTLETLLIAAFVYWIITIVLSLFQERLEKRMAQGEVRL